jgi:hypothetical protein
MVMLARSSHIVKEERPGTTFANLSTLAKAIGLPD